MSYIKGNFKKYIFRSYNDYVVGLFKVKETDLELDNDTITFTGYFKDLNEADLYLLNGEIVNHFKYGMQFNVVNYEILLPEEKDKIVEFLSSEIFKGIGKKKSEKIVNILGNDCLTLILEDPNILSKVPSLTIKQKETIYNSLFAYKSSYEKMLTLTKLGFSMKDSIKIEKYYNGDIDSVLENPYNLIDDIKEITFPKIEKIRANLSIDINDIDRVSYGIIYCLENISFSTGNTYASYNECLFYCKKFLNVGDEIIKNGLVNLVSSGKIILDNDKCILMTIYNSESYIAERLSFLVRNYNDLSFDEEINNVEEKLGVVFNVEQKEAINSALRFDFSVITGGPGTGKTTIIKAITSIYRDVYNLSKSDLLNDLVLLSPTGRASKRMSEGANLPSYTIHRFLKWQKEEDSFLINEENKSDAKLVIIDEASMLDNNLFYNLLLGLKEDCKIVLIGDYNQLPSVGAGQILKDIIESDIAPVTYLKKLYRQDSKSNINYFAQDILTGQLNLSLFNESDDLTFINCSQNNLIEKLEEFVYTYKDLPYDSWQILAPMYKGENGIDNLNVVVQSLVNKKSSQKNELVYNDVIYREDDKVIELVNNIEDNVFNGDIGQIIKVSRLKKKEIICDFDDNIVNYGMSSFENIKHGYAISIHKAQGSEFSVVILPVLNSYNFMLYKKIIYTAVTRAKDKLIILGDVAAIEKAITTDKDENRKTLLKNFLINSINK